MVVDRQCGRTRDQQPGARQGPGERDPGVPGLLEGLRQPVVHGGDAEQHRPAGSEFTGHTLGGEPSQVAYRPAPAQRPEHSEDQPVHMEERQRVDEDVVAGPPPGVLQGVQ